MTQFILSFLLVLPVAFAQSTPTRKASSAEIIASSKTSDWRELDQANMLYMDLDTGRVIVELAPTFAPRHVENVKALSREKYWDGLAIVRTQDNYVVQWADPNAEKPESKRKIKTAKETLGAEFDRDMAGVKFDPLKEKDVYATEVGYSDGFQVGRDPKTHKTWMLHCYGAVGAGRDNSIDSGGGSELYAVIGHSPRGLDRNVTLLGRVVQGIELLSSLPRGKAAMGFYEKPEQHTKIKSIRIGSDLPERDRVRFEAMKTDTKTFANLIEAKRNRPEEWFHYQAGHIDICNAQIPIRVKTLLH